MVAFLIAVLVDPTIEPQLGWLETSFLVSVYVYVCGTGLLVAYIEDRNIGEIGGLSFLREALLAQTMTASASHSGESLKRSTTEHFKTSWWCARRCLSWLR